MIKVGDRVIIGEFGGRKNLRGVVDAIYDIQPQSVVIVRLDDNSDVIKCAISCVTRVPDEVKPEQPEGIHITREAFRAATEEIIAVDDLMSVKNMLGENEMFTVIGAIGALKMLEKKLFGAEE